MNKTEQKECVCSPIVDILVEEYKTIDIHNTLFLKEGDIKGSKMTRMLSIFPMVMGKFALRIQPLRIQ